MRWSRFTLTDGFCFRLRPRTNVIKDIYLCSPKPKPGPKPQWYQQNRTVSVYDVRNLTQGSQFLRKYPVPILWSASIALLMGSSGSAGRKLHVPWLPCRRQLDERFHSGTANLHGEPLIVCLAATWLIGLLDRSTIIVQLIWRQIDHLEPSLTPLTWF